MPNISLIKSAVMQKVEFLFDLFSLFHLDSHPWVTRFAFVKNKNFIKKGANTLFRRTLRLGSIQNSIVLLTSP